MKRFALTALVVIVAAVAAFGAAPERAEAFWGRYDWTNPDVFCTNVVDGSGRIVGRKIVPNTPGIFAPTEPMKVSWQPMLNRWNGVRWIHDVKGAELVGFASMSHALPDSNGFVINMARGRHYRVSIFYRWYQNGVVVKTAHAWAGQHVTQQEAAGYISIPTWTDSGTSCRL